MSSTPADEDLIIIPERLPVPGIGATGETARAAYVSRAVTLLAPVIAIMRDLGLDEAGFRVAPGDVCWDWNGTGHVPEEAGGLLIGRYATSRETGDKLRTARDRIRAAADERGVLFSLPDTVLGFRSDGITLFGEPRPGWLRGRLD